MATTSPINIQPLPMQSVNLLIVPAPMLTQRIAGNTAQTVLPCVIATTTCGTVNNVNVTSGKRHTPPIKPAKRHRDEPTEIVRCKRRLEFNGFLRRSQSAATVRRNERERNRVRQINNTFATLRSHLPEGVVEPAPSNTKKLSKVDTLRGAIEYIGYLQQLLDDHDAVSAALSTQSSLQTSLTTPTEPASCSGVASPSSSVSGSDSAYESPLSPDDEDLLDFSTWFD